MYFHPECYYQYYLKVKKRAVAGDYNKFTRCPECAPPKLKRGTPAAADGEGGAGPSAPGDAPASGAGGRLGRPYTHPKVTKAPKKSA